MSAKTTEWALQWLRKADHDLITARQTLRAIGIKEGNVLRVAGEEIPL